ncbi:MAG: TonB-dependent receptor, partial [Methylococcaceae bacterium]|nr:TonB-dependent receptor [Methylococcaceae bacterium]
GYADGYDLLNVNLSSDRLVQGLDVSVGVYNLLNTHYEMLGGSGAADVPQNILRMNGREYRLKLQITY